MSFTLPAAIGLRRPATERIVKVQSSVIPLRSKRMTSALLLSGCAVTGAYVIAWLSSQQVEALAWAAWPCIGAILSSVVAILAPRKKEIGWTTLSRFLAAIVVGMVLPRVFAFFHPVLKEFLADPVLGIGGGFIAGLLGFTSIVVFIEKLYLQAPSISDQAIRQGKEVLIAKRSDKQRHE